MHQHVLGDQYQQSFATNVTTGTDSNLILLCHIVQDIVSSACRMF